MSCNDNNNNCNPCSGTYATESVASWLTNLTTQLFGAITKTVTNGRAIWSTPCSPDDSISAFPREANEGFICYILRILPLLGINLLGAYDAATAYSAGDIVTYGSYYWYRALVDTTGVTPGTDPATWTLILTGQPGPAGPSTGGSDVTRVVTATPDAPTNSDAVLLCEPSANMVINLPLISGLSAGKWYDIRTNSSTYTVTITAFAGNTIGGAATYVLSTNGETIRIRSASGSTDWRVC